MSVVLQNSFYVDCYISLSNFPVQFTRRWDCDIYFNTRCRNVFILPFRKRWKSVKIENKENYLHCAKIEVFTAVSLKIRTLETVTLYL